MTVTEVSQTYSYCWVNAVDSFLRAIGVRESNADSFRIEHAADGSQWRVLRDGVVVGHIVAKFENWKLTVECKSC